MAGADLVASKGNASSLASAGTVSNDDPKLAAFRPIRLRKAVDEVVSVLVDAIRGGIYQVGDTLPRERDLAERLEVSRATLREATSMLIQAGAITVRRGPGGGNVIASVAGLSDLLAVVHGRPETDLRSLLEVRRALELQAASLAIARATKEECDHLRSINSRLPQLVGDDDAFVEQSIQFLMTIGKMSHNQLLAEYITQFYSRYQVKRDEYPVGHVEITQIVEIHEEILRAIENKDYDALMAATDKRLASTEEYLIGERLWCPRFEKPASPPC